ncbi:MAG: nitrilase-related carbon-nitrogen hydrolase [Mariniblastus sp.]
MNDSTRKKLRLVWLFIFLGLSFFAGGRWASVAAAVLVPIFAIRFCRDVDNGWLGLLGLWAASSVAGIVSWRGATAFRFMGLFAEPAFIGVFSALALAPLFLDRLFYRRYSKLGANPYWLTFVFPIAAGGFDYLINSGSPFGTFGATAYELAGFELISPVVAVGGIWLVPFVLGWFASNVNYIWESGFAWQESKWPTCALATVGVLVLLASWQRPNLPAGTVMVGGFSHPNGVMIAPLRLFHDGDIEGFQELAKASAAAQFEQIRTMAHRGAKIVTLQEGAMMGFESDIAQILIDAALVAREESIYIVLPSVTIFPGQPGHNMVRIIDPDGNVVLEHIKFGGAMFEGTLAGSGKIPTVDTPYGRIAAVICWDADFPEVIKQVGKAKVDMLFVPANDWYEIRDIHVGMATFRSTENGTPIFRQTGNGISVVTDSYGREISRIDSFTETSADRWAGKQLVEVKVGSTPTWYPHIGGILGRVQVFGFLVLVMMFIGTSFFARSKS